MVAMKERLYKFDEDAVLRSLLDGTSAETGRGFFKALVKNLSKALGVRGAWVTEYFPERGRLRAIAFRLGDKYLEDYEYDVKGTPCESVVEKKTFFHIPDGVVEMFPEDPDLAEMGAASYMGVPLLDTRDNVLGNLAVFDGEPMPATFRNSAIFRIFAARASAEIGRMRAENDIRAREEKLKGLFDAAMDAIVELDHELKIRMMNPAAENIFDCSAEFAANKPFDFFLPREGASDFQKAVEELEKVSKNRASIWLPGGFDASARNGDRFRAEATLSRFEIGGEKCYVLILRNVEDRIKAEKTIESLRNEREYLREKIKNVYNFDKIVGQSKSLLEVLESVSEVARTDSTVLIYGETGVGKELVAQAIHSAGSRRNRPMITVNCAAIPPTLFESEFFGHEKGAFTGAVSRRQGRFLLADGGTLFLDEIGELPREFQAKLLRVLQEGEFEPVGGSASKKVDVRLIAATNRDLSKAVRENAFRADLYYRLNVFPVRIPPLRERGDDVVLLARHFAEEFARRMGRDNLRLPSEAAQRLKHYDWPGNVRELQNVIERGVVTARKGQVNLDRFLSETRVTVGSENEAGASPNRDGIKTAAEFSRMERENMLRALKTAR